MNIRYEADRLADPGIVLLDDIQYELIALDSAFLGSYNDGWCIKPL